MAANSDNKGECFIISRLGSDGSSERDHFEKVLRFLIAPAVEQVGYIARSALDLHTPAGMIGTDVIQHLYDAPLVIADLTGRNPNVYYELAVRHGYKRPVVQIVDRAALPLPFDIQTTRTIIYDTSDWNSIPACLELIAKQIAAVERNAEEVDNPIVQAFNLQSLKNSPNAEGKSLVLVLEEMAAIRSQLSQVMLIQQEEYRRRRQAERERSRRTHQEIDSSDATRRELDRLARQNSDVWLRDLASEDKELQRLLEENDRILRQSGHQRARTPESSKPTESSSEPS